MILRIHHSALLGTSKTRFRLAFMTQGMMVFLVLLVAGPLTPLSLPSG